MRCDWPDNPTEDRHERTFATTAISTRDRPELADTLSWASTLRRPVGARAMSFACTAGLTHATTGTARHGPRPFCADCTPVLPGAARLQPQRARAGQAGWASSRPAALPARCRSAPSPRCPAPAAAEASPGPAVGLARPTARLWPDEEACRSKPPTSRLLRRTLTDRQLDLPSRAVVLSRLPVDRRPLAMTCSRHHG